MWRQVLLALLFSSLVLALPGVANSAFANDGVVPPGIGPVNESMGGAGTATTLEPLGSISWNPAALKRLHRGWTIGFGATYLDPGQTLSSSVGNGAFAGSTDSNKDSAIAPTLAAVYNPCDSCWAFHAGVIGFGGLGVEYPEDPTNPILSPQPGGFGKIESEYLILRMPLGVSYAVNDKLALGFSVIPSVAGLTVTPAPFATPNGDGTYPAAGDRAWAYGIGFQVAAHYQINRCWAVGASVATPTWFTAFEWDSEDENGDHRGLEFDLDFPPYVSLGVAWQATRSTLLAMDFRWFGYGDTEGIGGTAGFSPAGDIPEFGWRSIWSFSVGIQQELGPRWAVRAGYHLSENPVRSEDMFFSSPAPGILKHHVSAGLSYRINQCVELQASAWYAIETSTTGPLYGPDPIPGSSVTTDFDTWAIGFGATFHF